MENPQCATGDRWHLADFLSYVGSGIGSAIECHPIRAFQYMDNTKKEWAISSGMAKFAKAFTGGGEDLFLAGSRPRQQRKVSTGALPVRGILC